MVLAPKVTLPARAAPCTAKWHMSTLGAHPLSSSVAVPILTSAITYHQLSVCQAELARDSLFGPGVAL